MVLAVIQASFVELTPLCFSCAIFFGSFVLQDMFYSVNKLVTYILYYCSGPPGCLISLLQVMLLLMSRVSHLSLSSFARVAVVFLVESYKTVIERRFYVSFINIKLFDLPV